MPTTTTTTSSSSPPQDKTTETLRSTWTKLYTQTLPSLARSKSPTQKKWPVTLDHCFARIILDNTLGKTNSTPDDKNNKTNKNVHQNTPNSSPVAAVAAVPWDTVIRRPAVRNMSADQLRAAIELGEGISRGEVDLVELDRASLVARGKEGGKYGGKGEKRERERDGKDEREEGMREKTRKKQKKNNGQQTTIAFAKGSSGDDDVENGSKMVVMTSKLERDLDVKSSLSREEIVTTLQRIKSEKGLTPFRCRLYTSLLSVPKGQYTTYAALASHLDSVARAVGNGMRNNPFAPDVPCHRVLASDGSIGGFGGDWGRDGKLTEKQDKKVALLKEEGVKFDSAGKVKGPVWKGFWDWEDFVREYGEIE